MEASFSDRWWRVKRSSILLLASVERFCPNAHLIAALVSAGSSPPTTLPTPLAISPIMPAEVETGMHPHAIASASANPNDSLLESWHTTCEL